MRNPDKVSLCIIIIFYPFPYLPLFGRGRGPTPRSQKAERAQPCPIIAHELAKVLNRGSQSKTFVDLVSRGLRIAFSVARLATLTPSLTAAANIATRASPRVSPPVSLHLLARVTILAAAVGHRLQTGTSGFFTTGTAAPETTCLYPRAP